ncbi:MAG TPA: hypothetical protein VF756_17275 [Thermoanaerobaculia bacterium]
MSRSRARVWMSLLALSLLAVPASAALFRVTLNNGTVIESAYQPQEASWDPDMVLLLTDAGNWIGLAKADVRTVEEDVQSTGYSIRLGQNTYELGLSANDVADPMAYALAAGEAGADANVDPRLLMMQRMMEQQQAEIQARQQQQNYTIQQFVEPGQTMGIPSGFTGPITTPITAGPNTSFSPILAGPGTSVPPATAGPGANPGAVTSPPQP